MIDLISRADAIEAVRKEYEDAINIGDNGDAIAYDVGRILSALPSADTDMSEYCDRLWEIAYKRGKAESEADWIPCSERLPKRDELVLVTYKTTDRIHLCKYIDDGSENPWWSYIDDCCAWNNVVLAWMPLPKPYREDGEV